MTSLDKWQLAYDLMEPEYGELEGIPVRDFDEAVNNIYSVMFKPNSYLDEDLLIESLKELNLALDSPNPQIKHLEADDIEIVKKYDYIALQNRHDQEKKETAEFISRHLLTLKVALYGDEKLDTFAINAAIKNLDWLVNKNSIEEKKLNIVRKGE